MYNDFCKSCGAPLEESAKFCRNCGKATSVNAVPIPQPAINTYSQPNYTYSSQNYNPNMEHNYYQQQNMYAPMSVSQFIGTILLTCIPIAGLVLLFVWAFSSDTNINRKNYARAALIVSAIGIGVYLFLLILSTILISIVSMS